MQSRLTNDKWTDNDILIYELNHELKMKKQILNIFKYYYNNTKVCNQNNYTDF